MRHYFVTVGHPKHEPKSEFSTTSPVAAWAALIALRGGFPSAQVSSSQFDSSESPPVRALSDDQLMEIALKEPSGVHTVLGTSKEEGK